MGYRNLFTSKGDGNCSVVMVTLPSSCIETYLPRKGTETELEIVCEEHPKICIETYLPRKGTET